MPIFMHTHNTVNALERDRATAAWEQDYFRIGMPAWVTAQSIGH